MTGRRVILKAAFYPLHSMILNYWFPRAEGYVLCPFSLIPGASRIGATDPEDYTISFVIKRHQQPLLLFEVRPPTDFHVTWRRESAIRQIGHRLDAIGPTNQQAGRLYAISTIGKRWRAIYAAQGKGSRGGRSVKGIAPVNSLRSADPECWNEDITSEASWEALQGIVETIRGYNV